MVAGSRSARLPYTARDPREPDPLSPVADLLVQVLSGLLASAAVDDTEARVAELAAEFVRHGHTRELPARAALLRQGDLWDRAFLIRRGLVRLHFLQRDGHEYNKNFYAEGSLVAPIAPSMWSAPSLFGISAIETVSLWVMDAAEMRRLLEARGLWLPVRAVLLERLVTGKLQREHDLLALDARERYAAFCSRLPDLAARVPLKHLATYLGVTDVSLSRIRRDPRRDRVD